MKINAEYIYRLHKSNGMLSNASFEQLVPRIFGKEFQNKNGALAENLEFSTKLLTLRLRKQGQY